MKKSEYRSQLKEVKTLVDKESGEIIDTETKYHSYIANSKEEFLMIYSSMLGVFMGMEQAEIRVYGYLLRYANGLHFSITKPLRIQMSSEVGLNERTIYNTINALKAKNLIFESSGLFQINPRYAFKGSSSDRNKALKAIIELGCKEC